MNYSNHYQVPEKKSLWRYYIETITKNYLNFSGRARRREYWGFTLYHSLIAFTLFVIGVVLFGSSIVEAVRHQSVGSIFAVFFAMAKSMSLLLLYSLAFFLPMLGVTVRRLQDRGMHWAWLAGLYASSFVSNILYSLLLNLGVLAATLLSLGFSIVILLYSVFILINLCLEGDTGDNQYGADPKSGVDNYYV